ncbi:TonB-dependent receptor [Vibrio sp. SCSIO 43136]|uniref:TonB-dependent receptor domain-containing protein n=1 Tax=Vibrio sp. SCSIO 43136 TaxID=2819101 RepID=UPI002075A99D|nr:TonB-dependent receptor [Vibrio sp. SCSIO 43136]USD65409.1 TonB-dependent receptor [Vibrio sp. SCSIO 43136]
MQKSLLATTVVSLLSMSSYAQAQSADETMVVTANRFEQSSQSSTAAVVTVDKEEIEAIQANDLFEVLRRLPGVQVSSNGGYGQTQSLFVRGTNSSHVLVLIDGVKTASATSGGATISALPLVAVQRIEFIRGPRAAMYGSDAVGGVINIITDTKREEKKLSAGIGSEQLRKASVAVSGELNDKLSGSFSSRYSQAEGFSAQNTKGNEDNDGHKVTEFAANAKYQLSNQLALKLNSTYSEGFVEYDPTDSSKDQQLYTVIGSAEYKADKYSALLSIAKSVDSSYNRGYKSKYHTEHESISFTNHYLLTSDWTLSAGIDWQQDDVSASSVAYDESSRDNKSAYVGAYFDNSSVQAELALRTDDNERYGRNNTWQTGLGWWVVDTMRLTANAGTAFKAPTFNNLYWPDTGNPNLKPEESFSYEVGVEGYQGSFDWSVVAYHNQIENMIIGWPSKNIGKADIKGIELAAQFATGAFSHDVSLDIMDPVDTSKNSQLARRAKESAKWNVSYSKGNWRADLSYLYQGKRIDTNKAELDSYSLVDIAASYSVTESLTLRGRVANLLDEDYTLATNYNTQGRSYYLNVDYKF